MENVLVTGGAGFVGSNLVEYLLEQEFNVKVIDDLSTGNNSNILDMNDRIEFIKGDLRDNVTIDRVLKDVSYVFHQAAIPSVSKSIIDPVKTAEVNIIGTLNLLNSARRNDIKKIIFASSSSVYGEIKELPKKEDMKMQPLSPYAVSKIAGEYYFDVFSKVYGFESVGLRYFNVYGPKQNPKSEYAAVIPRFINIMMKGDQPTIFGDGEQTRDFTYIRDVLKANLLALKTKTTGCEILNIGRGEPLRIKDLVDKINEILNVNISPIYSKPRKGDILHSVADITKAKSLIGYNPEYKIESGLKETVRWFRDRLS